MAINEWAKSRKCLRFTFSEFPLTENSCNDTNDIETTIEIEVNISNAIFFAGPKIFEINDSSVELIRTRRAMRKTGKHLSNFDSVYFWTSSEARVMLK